MLALTNEMFLSDGFILETEKQYFRQTKPKP